MTKVALSGANGQLGRVLRPALLARGYDLRSAAGSKPLDPLAPGENVMHGDLRDPAVVDRLMQGVDVLIHMAGTSVERPLPEIIENNLRGLVEVYEGARRHGVKRIVFASSVHAIGYYERTDTIDGTVQTRPDSLYGVSKTFVENLARYYFDKFGIETVCIRIGSSFPEPTDRRHLITWLSFEDCRQLVEKCLSAPRVGFMVAYGMSNNSESFWDNRTAAVLGYKAKDSADDYRDAIFAKTPQGDPNDPAVRFQGGSFCAAGHFEDENK